MNIPRPNQIGHIDGATGRVAVTVEDYINSPKLNEVAAFVFNPRLLPDDQWSPIGQVERISVGYRLWLNDDTERSLPVAANYTVYLEPQHLHLLGRSPSTKVVEIATHRKDRVLPFFGVRA